MYLCPNNERDNHTNSRATQARMLDFEEPIMIYMSHVARNSINRHMRLIISVIKRCATCSEQTTSPATLSRRLY